MNSYGTPEDWSTILSGAAKGYSTSQEGLSKYANTKQEAKEAKRRTFANMLNQSQKRRQGLYRLGQEQQSDLSDTQAQAIQQMARGFIDALNRPSAGGY
jgi:hypothetical protein